MTNKARRNYIRAISQRVDRKKMYKAKKQWIVAGMSFLLAMGVGTVATHASANADSTNNNVNTTKMANGNKNQSNSQTNNVQKQASALHNRILATNAISQPKTNVGVHNNVNSTKLASANSASNNTNSVTSGQSSFATNSSAINDQASVAPKKVSAVNTTNSVSNKATQQFSGSSTSVNKVTNTSASSTAPSNSVSASSVNTGKIASTSNKVNTKDVLANRIHKNVEETQQPKMATVAEPNLGASSTLSKREHAQYAQPNMPQVGNTNSWKDADFSDDPAQNGMSLKDTTNFGGIKGQWYSDQDHGNGKGDLLVLSPNGTANKFNPNDSRIIPGDVPFDRDNNWRLDVKNGVTFNANGPDGAAQAFSSGGATGMWSRFKSMDLRGLTIQPGDNLNQLFFGDSALQNVNISNWNTSGVYSMAGLFQNEHSLRNLDASSLTLPTTHTDKINASDMFAGDMKLETLDISGLSLPSQSAVNGLFTNDGNLDAIKLGNNPINANSDVANGTTDTSSIPFFNGNVDANGNPSTTKIAKGNQPAGWYFHAPNTPLEFVESPEENTFMPTGKSLVQFNTIDLSNPIIRVNYSGPTSENINDLNLPNILSSNPQLNGFYLLPNREQNYNSRMTDHNGVVFIPVQVGSNEVSDAYKFVVYDPSKPNNIGQQVSGTYPVRNVTRGSNYTISNASIDSEIPNGYHLLNPNVATFKVGDTKDNYEQGNPGAPGRGIRPQVGAHIIFVTQADTEGLYVVSDADAGTNNGKTISNTGLISDQHNANSDDITSSNDQGMPAGYHLVNANNMLPFDNHSHKIAVIGNSRNPNSDNNKPSDSDNPKPSDASDMITVNIHEMNGSHDVHDYTQYIAVSGRNGESYTVKPTQFTPNGYSIDTRRDHNLNGEFIVQNGMNKLTNPEATWYYDAKALDTKVNYVVSDSKNAKNGQTLGSHQFNGTTVDTNVDVDKTNDPGMPAGYTLKDANNEIPFDNGTHNVAIIGVMHNPNGHNVIPTPNPNPNNPSDIANMVKVHVHKYAGSTYQGSDTKYIEEQGHTGDSYSVSPDGFTPSNYVKTSSDQNLTGDFTANGIDANIPSNNINQITNNPVQVTWNYQVSGVIPKHPITPVHPHQPSDNPNYPNKPSDVPNNPNNPNPTPTPYDPQDANDTFYVTVKDWDYDKANGKFDHLKRTYMKRMTFGGAINSPFHVSTNRFATYGYHKTASDNDFTGHVEANSLTPENHVTWNYDADHVTGKAKLNLSYQQSDGTVNSDVTKDVPIDGYVDGPMITPANDVVNPHAYDRSGYTDNNSDWIIPLDAQSIFNTGVHVNQANGDTTNYDPTHTFVYVGRSQLGNITVNYVNNQDRGIDSVQTANKIGTNFNIRPYEQDVPQGYHFERVLSGLNVDKYVRGNSAITIQVGKNKRNSRQPQDLNGTIDVDYIDNSGRTVGTKTDTNRDGVYFDLGTYEQNVPKGYHFTHVISDPNVTEIMPRLQVVKLGVDQNVNDGTINVDYVNYAKKSLKDENTTGNIGSNFNLASYEKNVPAGYRFYRVLTGNNVSKYVKGNQNVAIQVLRVVHNVDNIKPGETVFYDNGKHTTLVTRVNVPNRWRWFMIHTTSLAHYKIDNVGNTTKTTYDKSFEPHHAIYRRIEKIFLVHSRDSNRVYSRYEFYNTAPKNVVRTIRQLQSAITRGTKRVRKLHNKKSIHRVRATIKHDKSMLKDINNKKYSLSNGKAERFITGNDNYTRNSYYQSNEFRNAEKHGRATLYVTRQSREYTSPRYNNKTYVRTLNVGKKLNVKKLIFIGRKGDYQTRFQLSNGHYVTANKNNVKLVPRGNNHPVRKAFKRLANKARK